MNLYFLSSSPATQAPEQNERRVLCVLKKMGGELVVAAWSGWLHRGWCLSLERQRENDTDFQGLHSFSSQKSIPQQSSAWCRITIHHLRCPSKAVFFLNLFIFSAIEEGKCSSGKELAKASLQNCSIFDKSKKQEIHFPLTLFGSYTTWAHLCMLIQPALKDRRKMVCVLSFSGKYSSALCSRLVDVWMMKFK